LERGHVPPTPMPTAAIALVKAATSGIPGAVGTPITDLWLTRRLDNGGGRLWQIAAD
jgi:hypothetical protein